jgi:hypothetical protein
MRTRRSWSTVAVAADRACLITPVKANTGAGVGVGVAIGIGVGVAIGTGVWLAAATALGFDEVPDDGGSTPAATRPAPMTTTRPTTARPARIGRRVELPAAGTAGGDAGGWDWAQAGVVVGWLGGHPGGVACGVDAGGYVGGAQAGGWTEVGVAGGGGGAQAGGVVASGGGGGGAQAGGVVASGAGLDA